MSLSLGEKQELFSECIAKLITEIYTRGYKVRCGDFWAKVRTPLEHKKDSQHYVKCAGDILLFKDGVYLTSEEHYIPFGQFWESLHPECRSGMHFKDSNHFEIRP